MKPARIRRYLISRQFLFSVNLQKWSYYYIGFSLVAQGPDLNLYQFSSELAALTSGKAYLAQLVVKGFHAGYPYLTVAGGVAQPHAVPLLFKEHRNGLAHKGVQIGVFHVLGDLSCPVGTVLLDGIGHLAGHLGGRSAGATGVGEDVHGGKAALLDEVQGLLEFILRLAGEAYDKVGGNGRAVIDFVEELHALIIPGRVILPVHPGKHRVTARLHGKMEVGTQVLQRGAAAAEVLRNGPGLQRAKAYTDVGGHRLTDGFHRVNEGGLSLQILSPGGNLNAGEDDLLIACLHQRFGLYSAIGQGQGADAATRIGDDAVGAEIDAAILDFQHGPGAALQPSGGQVLKGAALEGVVQNGDALVFLPGLLQQIHKAGAVAGTGNQVHLQLVHIVGVGLGVTAAHRQNGVRGGLSGPADYLPGLFVTDCRYRAGVDDIGVGLSVKGDQGVAALGDQLLQSLSLVLIYFAP